MVNINLMKLLFKTSTRKLRWCMVALAWCHPVIIVISVLLHRLGNLLQMWNKPEIERLYGYDLVSVSCLLSDNLNMYIYTEYVTNSTGL